MLVGKWSALCSLSTGPGSTGPSGPSGSASPANEVQWDCTAHMMPYLKMLHAWLLRVGANMPSINKPARRGDPTGRTFQRESAILTESRNFEAYLSTNRRTQVAAKSANINEDSAES